MRRLLDLFSAVLGCVVALLACEGVLRLIGFKEEASFFTKDADRAYTLRPHAEGWQTAEGESYVQVNSTGFNDRDHPLHAAPGTIRIAVLGSSETEALQVPKTQNFTALLERDLNRAGRKVETFNFGTDGYNLAQIYYTLHDEVWKYEPQIVLLCYSNFLALKNTPEVDHDPPEKVRFLVFPNGEPEFEATSRAAIAALPSASRTQLRDRIADITNSSALLTLLNHSMIALSREVSSARETLRASRTSAKATAVSDPSADYMTWWSYINPEDPNRPIDPRLQRTVEIGDQIIRKIATESRAHGAEFHLILLDQPLQVHPDSKVPAAFMKQHNLRSLDGAEERIVKFCRTQDVHVDLLKDFTLPLIPPGVAIRGFGDRMGEGHYNPGGHQILAQALTTLLLRDSAALNQPVY